MVRDSLLLEKEGSKKEICCAFFMLQVHATAFPGPRGHRKTGPRFGMYLLGRVLDVAGDAAVQDEEVRDVVLQREVEPVELEHAPVQPRPLARARDLHPTCTGGETTGFLWVPEHI